MSDLKQTRIAANVSQNELAKMTKIHASVISLYEAGAKQPPLEEMQKIESLFGSKIEWNDFLQPSQRIAIVAKIDDVSQLYPMDVVLEFCLKKLRQTNNPYDLFADLDDVINDNERRTIKPLM